MSTTDLVTDVLDYLVTTCQTAAAGGSLAGVTVFDGQQPTGAATGLEQVLWVGHNPMNPGGEIGEAEQTWPHVGDMGRAKDETGSVVCCAKHWTGDTSLKVHRDGCKAIAGAVELMLRGNAVSGGPGDIGLGGLVFWAGFSGATWWQHLVDDGAEAVCVFKISYFGRLTS